MTLLFFLLLLAALACFVAAATGRTTLRDRNMVALGLAFWVTVPLIQTLRSLL